MYCNRCILQLDFKRTENENRNNLCFYCVKQNHSRNKLSTKLFLIYIKKAR